MGTRLQFHFPCPVELAAGSQIQSMLYQIFSIFFLPTTLSLQAWGWNAAKDPLKIMVALWKCKHACAAVACLLSWEGSSSLTSRVTVCLPVNPSPEPALCPMPSPRWPTRAYPSPKWTKGKSRPHSRRSRLAWKLSRCHLVFWGHCHFSPNFSSYYTTHDSMWQSRCFPLVINFTLLAVNQNAWCPSKHPSTVQNLLVILLP